MYSPNIVHVGNLGRIRRSYHPRYPNKTLIRPIKIKKSHLEKSRPQPERVPDYPFSKAINHAFGVFRKTWFAMWENSLEILIESQRSHENNKRHQESHILRLKSFLNLAKHTLLYIYKRFGKSTHGLSSVISRYRSK